MNRNSKSVVSVIAAALIAMLASGCVSVPGEFGEGNAETFMPVDRGTGS